jgi:hypothetical protein
MTLCFLDCDAGRFRRVGFGGFVGSFGMRGASACGTGAGRRVGAGSVTGSVTGSVAVAGAVNDHVNVDDRGRAERGGPGA